MVLRVKSSIFLDSIQFSIFSRLLVVLSMTIFSEQLDLWILLLSWRKQKYDYMTMHCIVQCILWDAELKIFIKFSFDRYYQIFITSAISSKMFSLREYYSPDYSLIANHLITNDFWWNRCFTANNSNNNSKQMWILTLSFISPDLTTT